MCIHYNCLFEAFSEYLSIKCDDSNINGLTIDKVSFPFCYNLSYLIIPTICVCHRFMANLMVCYNITQCYRSNTAVSKRNLSIWFVSLMCSMWPFTRSSQFHSDTQQRFGFQDSSPFLVYSITTDSLCTDLATKRFTCPDELLLSYYHQC